MNKFYEFMRYRYGADELSAIIVLLSFAILLVVSIIDLWWLSLLPLALVIYAAWRILSKDIPARKKENEFIINAKNAILGLKNTKIEKKAKADNDFVIAKCPSCDAKLRLPKGKGEFSVTCPNCKKKLRVRS
ncbi:MAG: hypothetical protein IIW20_01075 [Clostridia bacterium]|nr:hypothetical protein [Clostridia bacterium]